MKKLQYLVLALASVAFSSCDMIDCDAPKTVQTYGNEQLQETKVVTVDQLKKTYADVIAASENSYKLIEDDLQLKVRVSGNDIQGNIYNNVAVEDASGSILIGVAQNGLFSFLPVGQEILINLKGLYIGSYGQQPQIGTPFTNARGATYVSRMNRYLWNEHFKLIGQPDASRVTIEEFDVSKIQDEDYLKSHSGKLMTIKNVSFVGADGRKPFATEAEKDAANSVNRELVGFNSRNIVVRTSTYADFAALPLPVGKTNITGVFTRFRNTWQILIRSINDVEYPLYK